MAQRAEIRMVHGESLINFAIAPLKLGALLYYFRHLT